MAACRKTLSAVLYGKDDLRLVEKELIEPHPNKGEVLLAIQSVGICGSDVHFWVDGHIGDFAVTAPTVMGHESSGLIMAVGEGVTHLKPGDRVAIEPGVPCYQCSYCKSGRYNLCPDVKFGSTPPVNGCLTRFFVHPADFCFKLPNHVSFDEGALVEPISVGVYACQRAQIKAGSRVLVCGSGPIGLVCMMVAKACGASEVIIIDLDMERLEVAKKCGADHVLQVKTTDSKQLAQDIIDLLGYKPDQTIECTGAKTAIATGIYATRSGGVLVLVGLGASEVALPIIDASVREVDIRGVFRYCNCYPAALDLVASGCINVKPLITHKYKLEEAVTAFQTAKTGKDGAIKKMLQIATLFSLLAVTLTASSKCDKFVGYSNTVNQTKDYLFINASCINNSYATVTWRPKRNVNIYQVTIEYACRNTSTSSLLPGYPKYLTQFSQFLSHTKVITDLPLAEDVICTFFGCVLDLNSGGYYYPNEMTDQCSLGLETTSSSLTFTMSTLYNTVKRTKTTSSSLTFTMSTLYSRVDRTSKINVLSTPSFVSSHPFISSSPITSIRNNKQIIIIFFVVLIITALICLGTMFVFVVVIYFGYQKQTKRLITSHDMVTFKKGNIVNISMFDDISITGSIVTIEQSLQIASSAIIQEKNIDSDFTNSLLHCDKEVIPIPPTHITLEKETGKNFPKNTFKISPCISKTEAFPRDDNHFINETTLNKSSNDDLTATRVFRRSHVSNCNPLAKHVLNYTSTLITPDSENGTNYVQTTSGIRNTSTDYVCDTNDYSLNRRHDLAAKDTKHQVLHADLEIDLLLEYNDIEQYDSQMIRTISDDCTTSNPPSRPHETSYVHHEPEIHHQSAVAANYLSAQYLSTPSMTSHNFCSTTSIGPVAKTPRYSSETDYIHLSTDTDVSGSFSHQDLAFTNGSKPSFEASWLETNICESGVPIADSYVN